MDEQVITLDEVTALLKGKRVRIKTHNTSSKVRKPSMPIFGVCTAIRQVGKVFELMLKSGSVYPLIAEKMTENSVAGPVGIGSSQRRHIQLAA